MKKLLVLSAAAAVAVPVSAYASAAYASSDPLVCHASFTGHPESGAGWALDTFTRTTTISTAHKGWQVHIDDAGSFTSVPGKPSDGDNNVPIENKVTGTLRGSGDYTVTGTGTPTCPADDTYTGTAGPTTGQWPLHFWPAGAVEASGIDPWRWEYRTRCEHMIEDSRFSHVDGNIVGKICPTPTPKPTPTTPTPTPTASKSASPSPSATSTTGSGTGEASPATPVTGQPHFTG